MKPPEDRPTPREPADSMQVRLAAMNVPESLAFVLKTIREDVDSLRRQGNASMGELYRHLEQWRDDVRNAVATDIATALKEHIAAHHVMNGDP